MTFNFRSISQLNTLIRENIPLLQEHKFELIVGIPRSGMLPASIIALDLNLPLMTLDEWIADKPIRHGMTRALSNPITHASEAQKVLIVDDSLSTGQSVIKVKENLSETLLAKACFLAVYIHEPTSLVDLSFEVVARPRLFEWNIMHHKILHHACVDIDGVLCCDPGPNIDDDGSNYLAFIRSAALLFKPTETIHTLVTNRLEKYRQPTEHWLGLHGIRYNNLVMLNLPDKTARLAQPDYFAHKVTAFIASECDLFIESDATQAHEISKRTHRSVYCVDTNEMVFGGSHMIAKAHAFDWKSRLRERLAQHPALFNATREIYRLLFNR
jgi:uncharacterized HAD superfamily protein